MSTALEMVINDLKSKLQNLYDDIDWHAKKRRDNEQQALMMKETIAELENQLIK